LALAELTGDIDFAMDISGLGPMIVGNGDMALVSGAYGRTAMVNVNLHVNGRTQTIDADDPNMPLLYALRDALELHGPKFGCGLGQCGACTVMVNGAAVRSCQMPVSQAQGKEITTLEGLGSPEQLHPVQAAFVAEQAAQCGYCTNGMIMAATALLAKTPHPTEAQVRTALAGNLCRCGTHVRILRAVMRASDQGGRSNG
jgi:nicotinate dehydrogenase subunit A